MIKIINRRYTKDATVRRSTTREKRRASGAHGKVVALDVKSGRFEVADSAESAGAALRARVPDADIRFERIGLHDFVKIRGRQSAR